MTRSKLSNPENAVTAEISRQVQELRLLTDHYCAGAGHVLLEHVPACSRVFFSASGSGSEFSRWAARQCLFAGLDACAVETDELARWPEMLFSADDLVIIHSPREKDRELLQKFNNKVLVLASSGNAKDFPQDCLSLSLLTGGEFNPLNTGALYWLLVRQLTRHLDGSEADKLKLLRQRAQLLMEGHGVVQDQWRKCLYGLDRLALLGFCSQSPAAAYTSLTLSLKYGIQNVFLHSLSGLEECLHSIGPGWGVIYFEDPSETESESESVFLPLQAQGARCIRVVEGFPQEFSETSRPGSALNADLTVFLNLISGQMMGAESSSL